MKNNEKILIAKSLLKITFIMLCISTALKLLGLNIFDVDRGNKILLFISKFISKYNLSMTIDFLLLLIQAYIFFRISCQNQNKKIYYISAVLITALTIIFQNLIYFNFYLGGSQISLIIYFLFTFVLLIIFAVLIDVKIKIPIKLTDNSFKNFVLKFSSRIKRPISILLVLSLYQLIVMFVRDITYIARYDNLYSFLLNFDYIILLLVSYYLFLKKETDSNLMSNFDFSTTRFLNEKPSVTDIKEMVNVVKEKYLAFKNSTKSEKIIIIVYIFFFILSELFNLAIIVFVAYLNHAIVECFFIVIAFSISRKVFGALHLDSAIKCWIVSNVSFFILNKITLNVGVTFVVPILCGISLSYITSKFIKQTSKSLYRGMPEKDLLKLCKKKKLNKLETDILIDFYCNRYSIVKLTHKYNYSKTMIHEHKQKAIKKIEQ